MSKASVFNPPVDFLPEGFLFSEGFPLTDFLLTVFFLIVFFAAAILYCTTLREFVIKSHGRILLKSPKIEKEAKIMQRFRMLFLAAIVFSFLTQAASPQQKPLGESQQPPPGESQQKPPESAQTPDRSSTPARALDRQLSREEFARIVEKFSEPNGYF